MADSGKVVFIMVFRIIEELDNYSSNTSYVDCKTLTSAKRFASRLCAGRLTPLYIYKGDDIVAYREWFSNKWKTCWYTDNFYRATLFCERGTLKAISLMLIMYLKKECIIMKNNTIAIRGYIACLGLWN